jgi:hypothetical protein
MKPGIGYCQMVTITTTDPQEALNCRNGVGAGWPFLADPGRVLQRDLDIAEYTDPAHHQIVPHTIVCEPGLIDHKLYNGYWFFGRPDGRGAAPRSVRGTDEAPLGLGSGQAPTSSPLGSTARPTASTRPSLDGRRMLLVLPRTDPEGPARPQPQT